MASGVILDHIPQKATHCAHHSAWIDSQTAAAPSPPYATPTNCPERTCTRQCKAPLLRCLQEESRLVSVEAHSLG